MSSALDAIGTSMQTSCSLADVYTVHTRVDDETYKWHLVPIEEARTNSYGVGESAKQSLKTSLPSDLSNTHEITCEIDQVDTDVPRVTVSVSLSENALEDNENQLFLLDVLARVQMQWAVALSMPYLKEGGKLHVTTPFDDKNGLILDSADVLTDTPTLLFQKYVEDKSNELEMSEMVDSNGKRLGSVPRILVHKLNILHRGIGVIVAKEIHITRETNTDKGEVEIYLHQRTSTKQIFPSLYDMFCGGVSKAGEDAKLTCAREVAEELGLSHALDEPGGDSLRGPLFDCVVCTSYNRCVVSLFTYKYTSLETIRHQEEEVQWGSFVPYHVVKESARMSMQRLKDRKAWPGQNNVEGKIDQNLKSGRVNWDYVPDGLLVWEAWLQWQEGEL